MLNWNLLEYFVMWQCKIFPLLPLSCYDLIRLDFKYTPPYVARMCQFVSLSMNASFLLHDLRRLLSNFTRLQSPAACMCHIVSSSANARLLLHDTWWFSSFLQCLLLLLMDARTVMPSVYHSNELSFDFTSRVSFPMSVHIVVLLPSCSRSFFHCTIIGDVSLHDSPTILLMPDSALPFSSRTIQISSVFLSHVLCFLLLPSSVCVLCSNSSPTLLCLCSNSSSTLLCLFWVIFGCFC